MVEDLHQTQNVNVIQKSTPRPLKIRTMHTASSFVVNAGVALSKQWQGQIPKHSNALKIPSLALRKQTQTTQYVTLPQNWHQIVLSTYSILIPTPKLSYRKHQVKSLLKRMGCSITCTRVKMALHCLSPRRGLNTSPACFLIGDHGVQMKPFISWKRL